MSDATFYDRINTMRKFIKSFFDTKKTSVFKLEMDLAKERDRGFNQG